MLEIEEMFLGRKPSEEVIVLEGRASKGQGSEIGLLWEVLMGRPG